MELQNGSMADSRRVEHAVISGTPNPDGTFYVRTNLRAHQIGHRFKDSRGIMWLRDGRRQTIEANVPADALPAVELELATGVLAVQDLSHEDAARVFSPARSFSVPCVLEAVRHDVYGTPATFEFEKAGREPTWRLQVLRLDRSVVIGETVFVAFYLSNDNARYFEGTAFMARAHPGSVNGRPVVLDLVLEGVGPLFDLTDPVPSGRTSPPTP